MQNINLLSAKRVRALGHSILTMFLLTVSILGVAVNPVVATDPLKEDVYPGATFYKKGSTDLFGCEQTKVFQYQYRTKDNVAKVVEFYKNHGFTILRDDSIYNCCITKKNHVLGLNKNGADVYVVIEDLWLEEETARLMNDTLISIASVSGSGK
jgi:hypothetical protein